MRAGKTLAPGQYGFHDFQQNDRLETGSMRITAGLIDRFARLTGDRYEIHMDDGAARAKGFAGRVAHGLLVLAVVDGLKNQAAAHFDGLASLGWRWTFSNPVLVGDEIHAVLTILSKRVTSDERRGIATIGFEVFNQRSERVQYGQNDLMFKL